MKIYFGSSARGFEELGKFYEEIYKTIIDLGHQHTDDYHDQIIPSIVYSYNYEEKVELYKRSVKAIKSAELVILEVSTHSLGLGYLIQYALNMGKPVVALCFKGKTPIFAEGIVNDKFQLVEYSNHNIREAVRDAIDFSKEQIDVRFNFFVSPQILTYLDWISKNRKLPRSVYLRNLIEAEMETNEEYRASIT